MSFNTYKCCMTPEDDKLEVETSFDMSGLLGVEIKSYALGQSPIVCLNITQVKALIKQLQKAVEDV